MAPSLLEERRKLESWTQPGRRWWLLRLFFTYLWLDRVPASLFPWGPITPAIGALWFYGSALLFWWMAARGVASARRRVLARRPRGFWDGWEGASVALFLPFVWRFSQQPGFPQTPLFVLAVFAGLVMIFEQSFMNQRGSFDLADAQDQALRAKLAPHFIFNALNTLHAQIEHDPKGAQATTEKLAHLFRNVVAVSDRPTVPLREELGFVEAYLGIERARMGDRLRVRIEVPEELESCGIPPLSLQVLVENAVKHGIAPSEEGGEIRIGASRKGRMLELSVEDPGKGTAAVPGTGTALETLRRRLASPSDLRLERAETGFRAAFSWPVA